MFAINKNDINYELFQDFEDEQSEQEIKILIDKFNFLSIIFDNLVNILNLKKNIPQLIKKRSSNGPQEIKQENLTFK